MWFYATPPLTTTRSQSLVHYKRVEFNSSLNHRLQLSKISLFARQFFFPAAFFNVDCEFSPQCCNCVCKRYLSTYHFAVTVSRTNSSAPQQRYYQLALRSAKLEDPSRLPPSNAHIIAARVHRCAKENRNTLSHRSSQCKMV